MKKQEKQIPFLFKEALRLILLCFFLIGFNLAFTQNIHPHIIVKPGDRQIILEKISTQQWAKKVFDKMKLSVDPYVERHKTDPDWILSRYLMNRASGKHYTRFFSDSDGSALVSYAGNAPFPTVRVSPQKRAPITSEGYSYRMPTIEELVPNDTAMKMWLTSNAPAGKKEWVEPGTFVEAINGQINQLALNAAIIYWLTGKEDYATFAADILSQWARGASYQNPIEGPCRTGFLSIQTLGDRHYEAMSLSYDFLYDFIRKKKYEIKWYDGVFEKIAATMTFRGFWNNNWFAAQSPAMVFAALSLENKQRQDYYLNFYLNKDTVNGECGHLALPSVVSKWLTPDGHWKEPGGYHNFPISSLLTSAVAMENNGYNVFGKHPELLQSSYVLLKYSFPNFSAPSIGDTGPVSQSPECLELGILMAKKYANPIESQLTAAMAVMMEKKGYKRETTDFFGLLTYLPDILTNKTVKYEWPRSSQLDFAKCYLQRNGSDREPGLMYLVQGATYNHNHANGMSLELYGAGRVMGIDPGKGITYEAPMHVNYYAQWAAHNTVVAGGVSSSVPYFKGGGGAKRMGQIELAAMEPKADKEAVSPYCSFTDTRYTDISTKSLQQRTLAIIRTSSTSGYYVDIYRSGHPKSNEYVYHNIGNELQLLGESRTPLRVTPTTFPISKEPLDPPGFRLIKHYKTTGKTDSGIVAIFKLRETGDDKYMQVLFTGENAREFYAGKGPISGTADIPYRNLLTPTLISRQQGEAWKRPFIAVYEAYDGKANFTVEKIQNVDRSQTEEFSAIEVFNKGGGRQIISQSVKGDGLHQKDNWQFHGHFGVIGTDKTGLKYLYLGDGKQISYQRYSVVSDQPAGAANVIINGNSLTVNCNQKTTIHVKGSSARTVILTESGKNKQLSIERTTKGISFTIPAVANAQIKIL